MKKFDTAGISDEDVTNLFGAAVYTHHFLWAWWETAPEEDRAKLGPVVGSLLRGLWNLADYLECDEGLPVPETLDDLAGIIARRDAAAAEPQACLPAERKAEDHSGIDCDQQIEEMPGFVEGEAQMEYASGNEASAEQANGFTNKGANWDQQNVRGFDATKFREARTPRD